MRYYATILIILLCSIPSLESHAQVASTPKPAAVVAKATPKVQAKGLTVIRLDHPAPAPAPAPAPVELSNLEVLEIKLRDYVVGQIMAEIKKHIEDELELSSEDIHVLALNICSGSSKPVTRSLINHILEKSKNVSKLCDILVGAK